MIRSSLGPYYLMGVLIAALLAVTGAAGLLVEGIYKPFMKPITAEVQNTQDLLSLLAAPVLLAAMYYTWRGSARALVIWGGVLVYTLYYYAFYAFDHVYTQLYPAYVALEGLSAFSLVGLLAGVDLEEFGRRVDRGMPVRFISVVLATTLLFVPIWMGLMLADMAAGRGRETATVFVLDLAFLIPACVYAAVLLWRRRPLGYLLGGVLLLKAPVSGVLLAVLTLRAAQIGASFAAEEMGMYLFLAIVGSLALGLYMRHLGTPSGRAARVLARPALNQQGA
jgi:hypothetical protein